MKQRRPTSAGPTLAKPIANAGVLQRLRFYLRPQIFVLICAGLAMAGSAATDAALMALLKPLLDDGFSTGSKSTFAHLLPLAIVGLAVVRGLAQYGSGYLLSRVTTSVLLELRREMFKSLLRARVVFFHQETASTIINAVIFEVNQILGTLGGVMITLVRDTLTVVFLMALLLYLNWQLTLVALAMFPVIAWLVSRINRRLRPLNREFQQETNRLSYIVEEAVGGYKVVKIHNGEGYERRRFADMSRRLRGYAMRIAVSGGIAQPLTQFIATVALAIMIVIAMAQAEHAHTTVGAFFSFVTAMLSIISPLRRVVDVNQPLQKGMTAAELIFGLIDEPPETSSGERPLERATGRLRFDKVSFRYANVGIATLDDISFEIAPGEVIALVGPSGSGKTSLVNLLPRFFDVSSGTIFIDDVPIQDFLLSDLRRQIAFVSQDVVLFNDTIAANVAYGQDIDLERVHRAIQAAYLTDTVAALPDGIETVVGDNGTRLSGGQRQRLAIARAIYKDAPILILDEATSALDSESERHVQAALEELMRGRTTLVIAHRLSTIEHADRIFAMTSGRIVESGSHEELLAQGGVYANLYEIQYRHAQTGSSDLIDEVG